MNKFSLKTPEELKIMEEGGKKLSTIKKQLVKEIVVGNNAKKIDDLAEKLILESGAYPSFKTVKNYKWSTCINVNEVVVHGIPREDIVFKKGDVISLDVGLLHKGFHTDTSTTIALTEDKKILRFLEAGKESLGSAINAIKPNNSYIYDLSEKMENVILKYDYHPVLDLTGHGIGKNLHEKPYIPCFVSQKRESTEKIIPGMALAIEIMYTAGSPELETKNDGWTIQTQDGKISGLFEDTVIVTEKGFKIIT